MQLTVSHLVELDEIVLLGLLPLPGHLAVVGSGGVFAELGLVGLHKVLQKADGLKGSSKLCFKLCRNLMVSSCSTNSS